MVLGDASTLLAGLLTRRGAASEPVRLEVQHRDGTVALLALGLVQSDAPESASPTARREKPPHQRAWVAQESVAPESIRALVEAFARATATPPGGFDSVIGAGAALAAVQSMEAMNLVSSSAEFEGLPELVSGVGYVSLGMSIQAAPAPELHHRSRLTC